MRFVTLTDDTGSKAFNGIRQSAVAGPGTTKNAKKSPPLIPSLGRELINNVLHKQTVFKVGVLQGFNSPTNLIAKELQLPVLQRATTYYSGGILCNERSPPTD